VHPDFLRFFLTSRHGHTALVAATTGSVIANLRPSAVQEIELPLPPRAEQERIVSSLRRLETSISELSDVVTTWREVHDAIREGIAAGELAPHGLHG
jgi:restriction endonuclease S subunit